MKDDIRWVPDHTPFIPAEMVSVPRETLKQIGHQMARNGMHHNANIVWDWLLATTTTAPQEANIVKLSTALERLLTWPNSHGTIEEYYIPKWLAAQCRDALEQK